MLIQLNRFFFDEKDIFTFFFGVFIVVSYLFQFSLLPFRRESLIVVFLFLIVVRSISSSLKFNGYFFITLTGLLLSMFLSPYGLAIYLFCALLFYTKTQHSL